jgi:hypothetical protein
VDSKRAAHRALVERILRGPGATTPEQRASAYANVDVPPPLQSLIGKVATDPTRITDADLATGVPDDQVVELVIAAAVGQATRLYEAGLAALAEATRDR